VAEAPPPLPTLLSWALVAFTIELDNAFETRLAHRTSAGGGRGPWLVSFALWSNVLRFVPEAGITVSELRRTARTPKLPLDGVRRWGYVTIDAGPGKPVSGAPRAGWAIRPTGHLRRAAEVWTPLPGEIEARWTARFGAEAVSRLCAALAAIAGRIETPLPDFLPILGYGLRAEVTADNPAAPPPTPVIETGLVALIARVLLAFTLDFEANSPLSLALSLNILARLDSKGARVRDLPAATGVSSAAVAMALRFLEKRGLAQTATLAGARSICLTEKGVKALAAAQERLAASESAWRYHFGQAAFADLRAALQPLVGDGTPQGSPLFAGLQPNPSGWRAKSWPPAILPAYPMILHRGGYPDGA
jgi:DNA-binding MarR family transcriptional regulator